MNIQDTLEEAFGFVTNGPILLKNFMKNWVTLFPLTIRSIGLTTIKNYESGNCRWVLSKDQSWNRDSTYFLKDQKFNRLTVIEYDSEKAIEKAIKESDKNVKWVVWEL